MKVKDLIKLLMKQNPENEVFMETKDSNEINIVEEIKFSDGTKATYIADNLGNIYE